MPQTFFFCEEKGKTERKTFKTFIIEALLDQYSFYCIEEEIEFGELKPIAQDYPAGQ